MKTVFWKCGVGLVAIVMGLEGVAGRAGETEAKVERVTMKGGKMMSVAGGKAELMSKKVQFPKEIHVLTNGVFKVGGGKPRKFLEGQSLGADGIMTSPDGAVGPVFNHVVMREGQPILIMDGEPGVVAQSTTLADGTIVEPDGYLVRDGKRRKLLDGELLKLDGTSLATQDTITLQGGKVMVQKDGSMLHIAPGRTMMMSEGTKVFGDGTVLRRDGTRSRLVEGQIMTIEGVAVK